MTWNLPGPKRAMLAGVFVIGVGVAVCWSLGVLRRTGESPKPVASAVLGQQFQALMASYQDDCRRRSRATSLARTDAERQAAPTVDEGAWARRAWALVQAAPDDSATLAACCDIATTFAYADEAPLALARLRNSFFHDARLGEFCPLLAISPAPATEQFLRSARTEHADPMTRVRAGLALARHVRWQALADHARKRKEGESLLNDYLDPNEEVRLIEEVEEICRTVMEGHADQPWTDLDGDSPAPTTMGKEAAALLASIEEVDVRRLAVGQVAPEVAAIDSDGLPLKLSGLRGKVVLLSFGGQHCVPCRQMIPHERDLRDRLKRRPFELVDFDRSEDKEAEDLKVFAAREKITWRVCPGRSREGWDIFRTWNVHAIPVFYLIDERGEIRQRFDGYTDPETLGGAVESLVREAEERAGRP